MRKRLQDALSLATPFSATVFRACGIQYATQTDVITGEGSRKFGGRWNPPGQFHAVYAALDARTAFDESLMTANKYAVTAAMQMPLVTVAIEAHLSSTLDLTTRPPRKALHVKLAEMIESNWKSAQGDRQEAFTQMIGRLAFEVGLEGLIVPSVLKHGCKNLLVFPERMQSTSRLCVINSEKLPAGPLG